MVQKKSYLNDLMKKQIITPTSDIKNKPDLKSELESQCLFGDVIDILKCEKNWTYIKSEKDSYKRMDKNKYNWRKNKINS